MSDFKEFCKAVVRCHLPNEAGMLWENIDKYFTTLGTWEITSGDAQWAFQGGRFTNVIGSDARVVFSPFAWFIGMGRRNPFTDLVLGLGDDVSFCLGARIECTYGGPEARYTRGPRLMKYGRPAAVLEGFHGKGAYALFETFEREARLKGPDADPVELANRNKQLWSNNITASDDKQSIA